MHDDTNLTIHEALVKMAKTAKTLVEANKAVEDHTLPADYTLPPHVQGNQK